MAPSAEAQSLALERGGGRWRLGVCERLEATPRAPTSSRAGADASPLRPGTAGLTRPHTTPPGASARLQTRNAPKAARRGGGAGAEHTRRVRRASPRAAWLASSASSSPALSSGSPGYIAVQRPHGPDWLGNTEVPHSKERLTERT